MLLKPLGKISNAFKQVGTKNPYTVSFGAQFFLYLPHPQKPSGLTFYDIIR